MREGTDEVTDGHAPAWDDAPPHAGDAPFAAAFATSRLSMVVADPRLPDCPMVHVNDAFCSLTGYSREELVGRNCRLLQGPGTDPATVTRIARAMAAGERVEADVLNYRRDGSAFLNRLAINPVRDADGALTHFFASMTDVTSGAAAQDDLEADASGDGAGPEARRSAESRLRVLNETLEQRVEDRTRALRQAEEALRQSQKMEAVGQLTGGIAHDFNNLLAGVSGGIDLARRRIAQGRVAEVERYLDLAATAVSRAAALTHRLLAFSRRQPLDPRVTSVAALVEGMADLVRRTAGPSVAVTSQCAPDAWNALVDPNQLENALLNLCINARDAMPAGGNLSIAAGNLVVGEGGDLSGDVGTGAYVTLSVTDTGSGMTAEVMARAFDPFFTTKPLGQGTGLGLSMIYGFAKQSGGHVAIASEVGRGTTVTILLPRHDGDHAPPAGPRAAAPPCRVGRGRTVLLVDDEATVRLLAAESLSDVGHDVMEASDGGSALAILRSDALIDVLVTDVGLPGGMNGRQLADAARELRPGLKVLFVTGYAEATVVGERVLGPGMALIGKPFSIDDLADGIRDLLAG